MERGLLVWWERLFEDVAAVFAGAEALEEAGVEERARMGWVCVKRG